MRRRFSFEESPDGAFRVDNVLPGAYVLRAEWHGTTSDADASALVDVPYAAQESDTTPLDIGVIQVRRRTILEIGQAAPNFEATTRDGSIVRLSDLRGKYVLLHFWATWCGPCRRELPYVRATWEAFSNDPRFAMIGLNLDAKLEDVQKFIAENEIGWPQGLLGDWSQTNVPESYGVRGIPAVFLIASDGKVRAGHLSGERIKAAVEQALKAR